MRLLNVPPVKVGDRVISVWTGYEWVTVEEVVPLVLFSDGVDWKLHFCGKSMWWINDSYWEVERNEVTQCTSGQAGAEV